MSEPLTLEHFEKFEKTIDRRFDAIHERFDASEKRFEEFVEDFTQKHGETVARLEKIDARLGELADYATLREDVRDLANRVNVLETTHAR
jgi:hypothetical protein